MSIRNSPSLLNNSLEIIYIGDIGFMFEVGQTLKHNLISPDVLSFFGGVKESGEVTDDCAFPHSIPNSNLCHSIFQYNGRAWAICSDGVFRKCTIIECEVKQNDTVHIATFYVDSSLNNKDILGVISKRETE